MISCSTAPAATDGRCLSNSETTLERELPRMNSGLVYNALICVSCILLRCEGLGCVQPEI